jgi:DNA-binding transcriptional regulator YhcF (GntR family)
MFIQIDLASSVPIYLQIRSAIIAAIASGGLSPGDELPSVRRLAVDIGVNMHTVNKAYGLLRREGYIEMNRKSGAAVARRLGGPDFAQTILAALVSVAAEARAGGLGRETFVEMAAQSYELSQNGIKEDSL